MPLTFPSHQGLILPAWRRWPHYFNGIALCVGAAMPDIVDGFAGIFRGRLGQWYGHSLIGLFLFCLPGGLILTMLTKALGECISQTATSNRVNTKVISRIGYYIELLNNFPNLRFFKNRYYLFLCFSIVLGGFSHLIFDFISHGNFVWLYPWYENIRISPIWWYAEWGSVSLPFYKSPYIIGPPTVVWIALTVAGIIIFFRLLLTKKRDQSLTMYK